MSAGLSPTQARRDAYANAKRMGCTCRPDIISRPHGVTEVRHDDDCPLAGTGTVLTPVGGEMIPTAFELGQAINLAVDGDTIVISVAEGVVVVPDSRDVPPLVAEFCDIVKVDRGDGRVARICSIPDNAIGGLS